MRKQKIGELLELYIARGYYIARVEIYSNPSYEYGYITEKRYLYHSKKDIIADLRNRGIVCRRGTY